MDERDIFGDRLREAIGWSGMTQRQLADACGVTEATVSRYVNGRRLPDVPMLRRMRDVLGCSYDMLIGVGDERV